MSVPVYCACCHVRPRWPECAATVWKKISSSNRVVTYFQRLSSGAPVSCSLDSPHSRIQGRSWRTCLYRRLCHLRKHYVNLFQHGSDLLRVSASSLKLESTSSTLRDIFRAASQILSYTGAYITAQPAVVQDAGLHWALWCSVTTSDKEFNVYRLLTVTYTSDVSVNKEVAKLWPPHEVHIHQKT